MKKEKFNHLRRSMKKAKAVVAVALIILVHSCFWVWLKSVLQNLEQENGAMENDQAICLTLCVTLWIWCCKRSELRANMILFGGLALFTASILILEIDFRNMDAPLLNAIMNGKIRNIWLGTFWLVGIILFVRNAKPVLNSFLSWLRTPAASLMIAGGVFWILSALIDKSLLGRKDLFNEELMEVNATLLMLVSALLTLWKSYWPTESACHSEPSLHARK